MTPLRAEGILDLALVEARPSRNSLVVVLSALALLTVAPHLRQTRTSLAQRHDEHTRLVLEVPLPQLSSLWGGGGGAASEGASRRRKQTPAALDYNPWSCQLDKEVRVLFSGGVGRSRRHGVKRAPPKKEGGSALPLHPPCPAERAACASKRHRCPTHQRALWGLLFCAQGSWRIGLFAGESPLDLRPFQDTLPLERRQRAHPNPIITCALATDFPGNFGARMQHAQRAIAAMQCAQPCSAHSVAAMPLGAGLCGGILGQAVEGGAAGTGGQCRYR